MPEEKRSENTSYKDKFESELGTFNISVCEVENQDLYYRISIGVSKVDLNNSQCNSSMESIISFIEENTDAEIIEIEDEIIDY